MEEILHRLGYPRMYKTYQLVQDFFHQQYFETLQLYDSPDRAIPWKCTQIVWLSPGQVGIRTLPW